MTRVSGDDLLEQTLGTKSISLGIPAYNEGHSLMPTLESLWNELDALHIPHSQVIVADSSRSLATVETIMEWRDRHRANVLVDRSERQRSKKEQLNSIFANASGDVLVCMDADVVIPPLSLRNLLYWLLIDPRSEIALGLSLPRPDMTGLRYRAGAWQMRAVARLARLQGRDQPRVAGYFWGCHRGFYETFRYPLGSGSIYDDVEIWRVIMDRDVRATSATSAMVWRTPVGTFDDFYSCTRREIASNPGYSKSRDELGAGIREAAADPVGAILWATYKAACIARSMCGMSRPGGSERWEPLASTRPRSN